MDILTLVMNAFSGSATALIVVSGLLAYMIYRANTLGHLDWTDLITARNSRSISLTKFLQLIGGMTGTWIMIYMTLNNKLTAELLIIYLTYVGAIEGYSKFVAARYNLPPEQTPLPTEK